jgi:hypothetical protein
VAGEDIVFQCHTHNVKMGVKLRVRVLLSGQGMETLGSPEEMLMPKTSVAKLVISTCVFDHV